MELAKNIQDLRAGFMHRLAMGIQNLFGQSLIGWMFNIMLIQIEQCRIYLPDFSEK
jgi:hypothetical protein